MLGSGIRKDRLRLPRGPRNCAGELGCGFEIFGVGRVGPRHDDGDLIIEIDHPGAIGGRWESVNSSELAHRSGADTNAPPHAVGNVELDG